MDSPDDAPQDRDRALRQLAATQLGVVERRQARRLLTNHQATSHRLNRGEWVSDGPRLLRHVAAPMTPRQRALAAVVDAGEGAALSHASAAALWGLPGFALEPAHVTIHRRAHPVRDPLGTVHRVRAFSLAHRTVLDGIPVVRPELLMLQLCATTPPGRAERLLDRAWSMRLLSGASTRRVLDEVAGSGVHGVSVLRELLAARGPDYVPPASGLEGRFAELLRRSGAAPMDRQVDLGGDHWCGRVDFVDRSCGLVVEIDSERYHSALSDQASDAAREAELRDAGFTVLRFTDFQVFHRPSEVIERIRQARSPSGR